MQEQGSDLQHMDCGSDGEEEPVLQGWEPLCSSRGNGFTWIATMTGMGPSCMCMPCSMGALRIGRGAKFTIQ